MKKINICNMFYLFIIGSVIGWFIEGLWTLLKKGILINHSALVIGPFNLIYGLSACVLTIFLLRMKKQNFSKVFIAGFLIGSILEYLMSLGMDFFFGFTAWDYSKKFLNINGRICLTYSIMWGFLSVIWIRYCYPLLDKLLNKINYKLKNIGFIIISVFLLFDGILTINAITRARSLEKGVLPRNTYEEYLDNNYNKEYLNSIFNNRW